MKIFETPVIEVEKLNIADVIATSNYTEPAGCGCDGFDPCGNDVCPLN